MPIDPVRYISKMKNWDAFACQSKPNVNRNDLWELIETKSDFFQKVDEYIKTGIAEEEIYGRAHQSINLNIAKH